MLKPLKKVFCLSFFLCVLLSSKFVASQVIADTTPVQFSGIVVTADSLKPIPFVNILIKDTWRGTVTDLYGFFSFVAHPKDVVVFNALGYKTVFYTIPDTLTINRYSLIQVLRPDTLLMNETVIYPWPTYEQFKQAFVNTDIPDDELERAKKNIDELEKRILFDELPMSSSMNFRNYIDNKVSQLYYAGQYRPNNLLNPIAWAQFIKAWREGKFKVKKQGD
ncbi:MAG TPA: carboxypeptidase-like regulatory domain-containing protein [Bacteroidales bacterium]|nr:carboxypeptidase-like regulatory domain-containing protein [Bacteroidales bacterium]HPI30558.1 carboxypeptidase-like regulatory domain-containing protein [Bacteroidales bacterium]HQN15511.1 carboxypeptidase-like regulatory domain-containing protein [Bacteroidales bacterium]HQP14803.1 carboxypeptidase-like regulatory domain-containing protein [Bacteroidales bacterium]